MLVIDRIQCRHERSHSRSIERIKKALLLGVLINQSEQKNSSLLPAAIRFPETPHHDISSR
jgi:hypothetical protein